MFRQILRVQWSSIKVAMLPLVLAAFVLPLASVQGQVIGASSAFDRAASVLATSQAWLPFFPALAALVGIAVALGAWAWDQQGKHVYALTLPLTRQKYVLMKLAAGAALVAVPGAALWIGAVAATATVDIPSGLHAYPTAVAIRFGLASLLAYSAVFAMSAWSGRRAITAISVSAGLLLLSEIGLRVAGGTWAPELAMFSPTAWVLEVAGTMPGPFGVFTGNWAMIDV